MRASFLSYEDHRLIYFRRRHELDSSSARRRPPNLPAATAIRGDTRQQAHRALGRAQRSVRAHTVGLRAPGHGPSVREQARPRGPHDLLGAAGAAVLVATVSLRYQYHISSSPDERQQTTCPPRCKSDQLNQSSTVRRKAVGFQTRLCRLEKGCAGSIFSATRTVTEHATGPTVFAFHPRAFRKEIAGRECNLAGILLNGKVHAVVST